MGTRDAREVLVVGCGAMTTLGVSAAASAAAVRAGISAGREHPFVVDRAGRRMVVAAAPYLDIDLPAPRRLSLLAGSAAVEAVGRMGAGQGDPISIHVGLPPPRPGRGTDVSVVASHVLQEVATAARARCEIARIIETGHAAGAMAIAEAWTMIRSGACEFALAGGVDSYLEPETLEWLESCDQVHGAGDENNPYGFVPGEAAGFVLLASSEAASRQGGRATLEISKAACVQESKVIKSETICTGEAMSDLFEALGAGSKTGLVDRLYCDMNGEPYRADEYGFASIRAGLLADASAFEAPADRWGDVGAASGPLFLVLAHAEAKRNGGARTVFGAFTGSESGQRCGFVAHSQLFRGSFSC